VRQLWYVEIPFAIDPDQEYSDVDTFNNISDAFLLNKPYVYDSNLPKALATKVPEMESVISKKWDSKVLTFP